MHGRDVRRSDETRGPDSTALNLEVPTPSAIDRLRAVGLGAIGAVPLGGSPAAAILGEIWRGPLARRQETLLAELVRRLIQVERAIADRDLVRDAVLSTASIAAQDALTSDDAKIEILANAVANVIVDCSWEHDEAVTLVRLLGQLTASHLRVLVLLRDPDAWSQQHGVEIRAVQGDDGSYRLRDMISDALERRGDDVVGLQTILQDLESKGLLASVGLANETPREAPKELTALSSDLGDLIVDFVTWKPGSQDRG